MTQKPTFMIHVREYHTERTISLNVHQIASYRETDRSEFTLENGQHYHVTRAKPTEVQMMNGSIYYVLDAPAEIDTLMAETERGTQ